jgi:hypothetical protein
MVFKRKWQDFLDLVHQSYARILPCIFFEHNFYFYLKFKKKNFINQNQLENSYNQMRDNYIFKMKLKKIGYS